MKEKITDSFNKIVDPWHILHIAELVVLIFSYIVMFPVLIYMPFIFLLFLIEGNNLYKDFFGIFIVIFLSLITYFVYWLLTRKLKKFFIFAYFSISFVLIYLFYIINLDMAQLGTMFPSISKAIVYFVEIVLGLAIVFITPLFLAHSLSKFLHNKASPKYLFWIIMPIVAVCSIFLLPRIMDLLYRQSAFFDAIVKILLGPLIIPHLRYLFTKDFKFDFRSVNNYTEY
ncbi:hypothetical protein JW930_02145 [Candidatus Woesearchaeota archaeon]|nr:hypothetical protein [Candidatus Woesearchaeota archaeon]